MRTTINIDDELMAEAMEATGSKEKTTVVEVALRELVARAAARRLANLAGTEPDLKPVPRRRYW